MEPLDRARVSQSRTWASNAWKSENASNPHEVTAFELKNCQNARRFDDRGERLA